MAFWAPLATKPAMMPAEMTRAYAIVAPIKSPNAGAIGRTGLWQQRIDDDPLAQENISPWLAKLNPEVVLIMFGSNDVTQLSGEEYIAATRAVIQRCLANGTIVIVSTMPPRAGHLEKSREFAQRIRTLAAELQVPLTDYSAEILKRRPDDWTAHCRNLKRFPETPTTCPR
jgi:hypothetical protein